LKRQSVPDNRAPISHCGIHEIRHRTNDFRPFMTPGLSRDVAVVDSLILSWRPIQVEYPAAGWGGRSDSATDSLEAGPNRGAVSRAEDAEVYVPSASSSVKFWNPGYFAAIAG
jgi:hypothetical protein